MNQMKQGEHYVCDCGAELVVIKPCTCEQKSELTCTCGMKMRARQIAKV